ncbi:hypothetical protein [uncultured Draconibacterium sp.]|uniref:hypothetical protein n=1 Tax=uncultured Draconibacterium sp. TaxID=1573823 RepID=UPI0025CB8BE0|nr:hypothetical protein [uncultured Draconibacterium sp.]
MNRDPFREMKIDETKEFKSFAEEIDYLIEFFKRFGELIFYNGRIISFFTDKKVFFLNTYLIDSSAQTLRSIKFCCSIGSFSDANTLIRKLRDDLIQYVYILSIINSRKPFVEDDLKNLKTDDPEEFINSFSNIRFNDVLTDDEKAVSAWFNNSVSELNRPIKKKLEFENYMRTLKQNENIAKILVEYKLKNYWEFLRRKLNDYVHNNGVRFAAQNSIRRNDVNLEIHLKNINIRTSHIASFFIIVLLMIDSALIASTDYMDHVNCDLKPPDDSQYHIAGFIQDFIDLKVSKLHPELKQYLIDNNINGMKIE